MSFHEIRFPADVSRGSTGGPERRTQVVALASGHEARNQQWAESRRRYDAGTGIKDADALHAVITFFEERRGRAHGFRWKDWADYKSCAPLAVPTPADQAIGTGDGVETEFQLVKVYGAAHLPWTRTIAKPVAGTVRVAVAGIELAPVTDFAVDVTTGRVAFVSPPEVDASVTAGFEFDVPVRFDTDVIGVDLASVRHGAIPQIPVVEIRI
ncbi:phage distal tail protein, Rcc01695 family [Microbaculum sp. FT89]|uniref:phage distal tail protein, Rcc01695 family n=1 Tax=Microbaculum sp. FT89 TaxID=3447298 RepID=UPI003F531836